MESLPLPLIHISINTISHFFHSFCSHTGLPSAKIQSFSGLLFSLTPYSVLEVFTLIPVKLFLGFLQPIDRGVFAAQFYGWTE